MQNAILACVQIEFDAFQDNLQNCLRERAPPLARFPRRRGHDFRGSLGVEMTVQAEAIPVQAVEPVQAAGPKTAVRWKIFVLMLFLISINYIDRASLSVAM